MTEINASVARKVLSAVDAGLVRGMGKQKPGAMCVEAAVCYALGLPASDNPPCVGHAVREFTIRLNDLEWSSREARAKGMRRLAIAQLGSNEIDQGAFGQQVAEQTVRRVMPMVLDATYRSVEIAEKIAHNAVSLRSALLAAGLAAFVGSVRDDRDRVFTAVADTAVEALTMLRCKGVDWLPVEMPTG